MKLITDIPLPHVLLHQVISMDQNWMPAPWTTDNWLSIDWNHHWIFCLVDEDNVLGFALFQMIPGDDYAHLLKIVVDPVRRRQGLAETILREAEGAAVNKGQVQRFVLEVAESNPARKFYETQGYQVERLIKGYYSDGQMGVLMTKKLI